MSVPFEIDIDSFDFPKGKPLDLDTKISHENLLNSWLKSGVLLYNGNELSDSLLFKIINSLPQSVKKDWQEAIKHYPRVQSSLATWNGQINKDLIIKIPEKPAVLIVEETKALVDFEINEEQPSKVDLINQTEIVKFKYSSQSEYFRLDQNISISHIKKSDDFSKVWRERFHWLAASENITKVAILDRYAMLNHLEWLKKPRNGTSGLERFLRLLDTSSTSKKYVKLLTAWSSNKADFSFQNQFYQEFTNSITDIYMRLPKKKISKIIVHILSGSDFSETHDRHIRFGDFHIWDLGKGLSCFEGNAHVIQETTSALKADLNIAKEYLAKEITLESIKNRFHQKFEVDSSGIHHF